MKVEFYAGIAAFRRITRFYDKVCLAGILNGSYALGDLPFMKEGISYMVDSGAFQDIDRNVRLPFDEALARQLDIAECAGGVPDSIVTYDFLVDEKLVDGRKIKDRVDYEVAEHYVKETILASKYYDGIRGSLNGRTKIIMSCQGVTPEQYTDCAKEVLQYCESGDVLGLGGFCILGRKKRLMPSALLTFQQVLPLVREAGLKKVHIFGVTTLDILYILAKMCKNLDLELSTDSTSMARAARLGGCFEPVTGRRRHVVGVKNDETLAILNVVNFAWVLEDIENRYEYKGKSGWLAAIDFDFSASTEIPIY